jgi:hypothetical protein
MLTDERINEIQDEAGIAFKRSRARVCGQQIQPSDSPDWWFARAIEAEATAPLLARIAELDKELAFTNEMNDQLREQNDLVGQACAELEADAKRLEFVESRLFGKSWNGVIDSGSRTDWRVASDHRHITRKMVGHTFRDALDNAMKEQP